MAEGESDEGWSTSFLKSPHALGMANRKKLYSCHFMGTKLSPGETKAEGTEVGITESGGQGRKAR